MKKRKYQRCFTRTISTPKANYTCRYNVNHSLISIYPAVPDDVMSLYRGTSPAQLENLAADLGGYIDD